MRNEVPGQHYAKICHVCLLDMNPSQLFLANEQSFNDGFDTRLITDAVVCLCV